MMRDSKFLRRNSGKNLNLEETENVPVNLNLRDSSVVARMGTESYSRPPLNTIQEPQQNPSKPDQESGFKSSKICRTPTKAKVRYPESGMPMRTPEKQGILARNRNGWGQDSRDEGRIGNVNTPRSCRTLGRTSSVFSEPNSTQSTPTKSVSKPPNPGLVYGGNSRPPINGGARTCNFTALSKGIPLTCNTYTTVNAIEVPHFDLREDPSFWMDHNVQVLIRIRPLNGMEIGTQGYNRCLKQESAQCLTWVGHPETRFTFDHVACETINQETLFKMVGLPMVENCLSGYNSCMFAYGQTGSGKTHTMLGEISDLEVKPSPHRGMTPRIFEFLFARIIAEEESRRDERLTYNCKCSFLEIYNEQITDLLDPSSTNLQLREDVKKGVYVENLTEFEVHTVGDILKLLSQGSANRRVAATNMNRESSRSHSVFTCVIESRWEKDSTSNLRFARLNLVDLAGSERQKTSGAEGERLKEAASINKSLSTLGHVIMVLVDGANARTRHVPYRDSRLTFLLQDSLGGNSKTMIIANVSPSISSATETLNTLKFAQRAKLIQNNAVINEDASGDVTALQHQIRLLKEELAILKRHHISRSLTFSSKYIEEARQEHENCSNTSSLENMFGDEDKVLRVSSKQLKSLETSLNGALRREQSTENSIKQLEAEIEQLNCLVRQREEENRCTKMMLKFREDKIQRMESLLAGSIPADSYLLEENNTLSEEIRILRAKVDRNPEVTRFAVENIRLLEQLRRFQDFYEEGEREILMTEVSELRDQLVLFLDENSKQDNHMNSSMEKEASEDKKENDSLQSELKKSQEELEKFRDNLNSCLEKNSKLCREIADLNALLEMQKSAVHDQDGGIEVIKESILESSSIGDHPSHAVQKKDENLAKDTEELVDLQLEVEILKIILKEERSTRGEIEGKALCLSGDLKSTEEKFLLITKQCENLKEELQEAKSVIEVLEIQQLVSINELEDLKNSNKQYAEILHEKELKMTYLNNQILSQASRDLLPSSNHLENEDSPLKAKLNKVQDSLSKAKRLNMWYQTDRACHASNEEEMDEVRRQVESETAEVIVCLQEELGCFQQQMHESSLKERETEQELTLLQEKLGVMTECNKALSEKCEEKDRKLSSLSEESDLLTNKIEEVLTAGHMVLDEALNQLGPGKRIWVSEQLQILARSISEKELRIEELNSCLEDAKSRGNEMECMLRSLRGATLVMSEAHQQDCSKKDQDIQQLLSKLSEKSSIVNQLDDTIKQKEEQNRAMSVCATAAFVIVNRFSEIKSGCLEALTQKEAEVDKSAEFLMAKDSLIHNQAVAIDDAEKQIQSLKVELETAAHNCEKLTSEEEVQFSEKQNSRSIEFIVPQVLALQAVVDNFQEQVGAAMVSLDSRLQTIEGLLQKSRESCFQERKLYELELTDAKLYAVQQAVESSCYLDKFVETQHKIKEADFMIYKLVTANEAMKMDIAELKGKEVTLINERDMLKDSYSLLGKQFHTDMMGMKREIEELELMILQIQVTVDEDLMATASGFFGIKSQFYDTSKLMRSWCEDIWSEIIAKDWAVSVLHVCHMGILMETVTGLNAENSILYHGLCESDSLVSKLKEQNGKSRRELEACSMLRGKFLADIKNSFDLISRKEDEAGKLSIKVNSFEKKILDLQLLEETMLEGSSRMGHELSMLMKEMDISHQKQQVINDKDEELRCLEEKLVMDFSAKEIELFIMLLKLEQMASENNDLEKEKISMSMIVEKFKEGMIISCVDMQLKDWILQEKDAEVGLLQKEALKISSNCCSALEQMASENNDLEKENISMSMVLEKFKEDMIISCVDMQLKDWILQEKDAEVGLLQKEALKISSNCCSALEQMASENNNLEKEKDSMSMVLEKFKEDMIISCVDMQLKDEILLEKDADVGLLQKEALKISSNCCSALEQMASENNNLEKEKDSMSMVLEKFKEDMIISCVDMQLKDEILLEKDADVGLLQQEALKISSNCCSALEQMASENNNLEKEKDNMSMVLEKFKEDMIISCVDMQLKDEILLEKDADVSLLQKEALKISYNHSSALEHMASETNDLEKEKISMSMVLEKFKEDMIISCVDMQLKDWILLEKDAEFGLLQKEALKMSYNHSSALEHMASENNYLEKDKISMFMVLEKFKEDMIILHVDMQLKDWILLEKDAEVGLLHKEVKMLEEDLKISSNCCSALEQMALENNDLEKEKISVSMVLEKFKEDMIILYVDMQLKDWILLEKDAEVGLLQKEVEMLEEDLKISSNCCSALEQMALENNDLDKEKISMSMVLEKFKEDMIISFVDMQLKDWILLEKDAKVGLLQKEVEMLEEDLKISSNCCSALEQMALENNDLEKEKISMSTVLEKFKEDMIISYVDMQLKDWILLEKDAEVGLLQKEVEMQEEALKISSNHSFALDYKNQMLEALSCKLQHDLEIKGAELRNLRLHKEENETLVVIIKDQKGEIEEFEASVEALEYELYEHVVRGQVLEAQLKEKVALTSILEAEFSRERECIKSPSSEILLLTENVEDALKAKESTKEQLAETMKAKESLEMEILELETILDKKNTLIELLKGDLKTVTCERSDLHTELLRARKEVEMAQALAEEHEAIAMEAKQASEISIQYAGAREEELKLYEKSVEELECTVNVLENQVNMVKGDAERQRLQREELELELHALKQQIHTVKSSDSDMRRHLDEKEKSLQDVVQHIKILEKEIASKDAEIVQHKDHITELNLHAEAQAREYKQTFKALETMADQVKPDGTSPHISNSPSKKLERNGSRSRGSGSPFKCIGLGMVQQMKSERDEELTAARVRIEELEALAASRQKEIFTLNAKLVMSGSMTHDVLRDLLGIKSDMTTYSSIVDGNQIEEVTEKTRIHNADPQVKEQEVIKLKQQLNEFVVERQRWREEIERKQMEMVAAQVALEQIRQQEQLITTENEMFKTENANHKKKVIDLEAEVKKLSGQQNLQQRIHHHAKIKEENNALRAQNEEINHKLRRSEAMVTRIKEELASFRAATGKNPC